MCKGQIIYVRRCLNLDHSIVPVFLVSKNMIERRCIMLSDDTKISKLGYYWTREKSHEAYNDILLTNKQDSVIGCEYRYPRASIYAHRYYLTQLHR